MAHKLLLLGTADASGIPNAFCACASCDRARKAGGLEVRTRASARLDDTLHFDLSPDLFWQTMKNGLCLTDLEHLFITHYHADHFAVDALELLAMSKHERGTPLSVYASQGVFDALAMHPLYVSLRAHLQKRDLVRFVPVGPHNGARVPGHEVAAIWGNHTGDLCSGRALNYLVTGEDGKRLLYATDTGPYREEQFAALSGVRLHVLVLECTFSDDRDDPMGGHHDMNNFPRTLAALYARGVIDQDTRVVATHIGHHHLAYPHDELQAELNRRCCVPVSVGYDGQIITY